VFCSQAATEEVCNICFYEMKGTGIHCVFQCPASMETLGEPMEDHEQHAEAITPLHHFFRDLCPKAYGLEAVLV